MWVILLAGGGEVATVIAIFLLVVFGYIAYQIWRGYRNL